MTEAKRPNPTEMAVRHLRATEHFLKSHGVIESLGNILMGVPYRTHIKFREYWSQDQIYETLSPHDDERARQIEQLRVEWRKTYDPFSGENLAAVALHQADRYGLKGFPKEKTKEYERLEKVMDRWGKNMKLLVAEMGEENAIALMKSDYGLAA